MSSAYYNENDKHAAAWLRELIRAGLIMDGEVDERSIHDVQPSDLDGFTRCHFFAGIGGWDYALQLAGWPADRPVWTGSCPCQPFSSAGKNRGIDDPRHLWPEFRRLILKRRPGEWFGEQVANKGGLAWFDEVQSDMEEADYACGSIDVPAVAIGADHIRHRQWVASYDTRVDGEARRCLVAGSVRRPQASIGGLPRLHVAGGRWRTDAGIACEPTLVPNHDGLSPVLAGFGNAIVPQVAAEFIAAYMETE